MGVSSTLLHAAILSVNHAMECVDQVPDDDQDTMLWAYHILKDVRQTLIEFNEDSHPGGMVV